MQARKKVSSAYFWLFSFYHITTTSFSHQPRLFLSERDPAKGDERRICAKKTRARLRYAGEVCPEFSGVEGSLAR